MSAVTYTIKPARLGAHVFAITCRIETPDPSGQSVSLPAWIPGSYLVRDFAKHVMAIRAVTESGSSVKIKKIDKSTWLLEPASEPIIIHYEVYAHDLSVRGAHLDTTHGFFNGTSVFLRVAGLENQDSEVEIQAPDARPDWRVATTLDRLSGDNYGFGRFQAKDYEELIDHPVEMGDFKLVEYEACGVPHAMVLTGRCRFDEKRLAEDLTRVCETQIRFFGEPAPMQRYLFLTMVLSQGYGGLEHRCSSALVCSREDLPAVGQKKITPEYRQFLGLCSHEYFHLWNVKRIKPAVFSPYQLEGESYTELLWVFEGITSYYDDLMLVRSGLINVNQYLSLLEKTVRRVWSAPGRFKQSLAESSFDAWVKLYKPDENSINAGISYYSKGSLVALALDLTIRLRSENQHSLDSVMKTVWQTFGAQGMPERGFEQLAEQVTGLDLTDFFDRCVRGVTDPELPELLAEFGVHWQLKAEKKTPVQAAGEKRSIGLNIKKQGDKVLVAATLDDGSAQKAGVSSGDELVAFDGVRVTPVNYEKLLRSYPETATMMVSVFRRDELMEFEVEVQNAPKTVCCLTVNTESDADTIARQADWLGQ